MKAKNINISIIILLIVGFIVMVSFNSCKKWIEVDQPSNSITSETVFSNVNTSTSVLNNVYFKMQATLILGNTLGFVADELKTRTTDLNITPCYANDYQTENSRIPSIWDNCYRIWIYNLNLVIEGVTASKGLSENNKKTLIAEAKYTRAFLYFYLINLFGDVPLVLTTDYNANSNIGRSSVDGIYKQIIADLNECKLNLPSTYLGADLMTPTVDRVRPTKWAATALLARIYLFRENWTAAEQNSTELINNSIMFHLESLDNVFKKSSLETIWALQPDIIQSADAPNNTVEAQFYIPYPNSLPNYLPNDELYEQFSGDDQRKSKWFGISNDTTVTPNKQYSYPFKYKLGNNYTTFFQDQQEHLVVLRLAEQYLIRAEARCQLDRITGLNSAAEDLNSIRTRAGLLGTVAQSKAEMLNAILNERRLELFTEWGHRWMDLKRTKNVDAVMGQETPKKGGQWVSYKALFPIPFGEFQLNPALRGHQNPGYRENK